MDHVDEWKDGFIPSWVLEKLLLKLLLKKYSLGFFDFIGIIKDPLWIVTGSYFV